MIKGEGMENGKELWSWFRGRCCGRPVNGFA